MPKRVIVIAGPTACGKTEIAVAVAKEINGEIISADSMQLYREMSIGTAKPTPDEMRGIPHHMVDVVSISEAFSVAMYQYMAFMNIEDILSRGKTPVVVGGTGLYINSLLYNLDFTQTIKDDAYRAELQAIENAELHGMLKKQDEAAALRIHPNDKKRLIRRLEILKSGGDADYNFREKNTDYDFLCIGISMNRSDLYKRIEARVDKMIERGLVAEVAGIYKKYPAHLVALQAIGYKEIIGYLEGRCTLEEAVLSIKKNTRRFAKRQFTWFNNEERLIWFEFNEQDGIKKIEEEIFGAILTSGK